MYPKIGLSYLCLGFFEDFVLQDVRFNVLSRKFFWFRRFVSRFKLVLEKHYFFNQATILAINAEYLQLEQPDLLNTFRGAVHLVLDRVICPDSKVFSKFERV